MILLSGDDPLIKRENSYAAASVAGFNHSHCDAAAESRIAISMMPAAGDQ